MTHSLKVAMKRLITRDVRQKNPLLEVYGKYASLGKSSVLIRKKIEEISEKRLQNIANLGSD